MSGRPWPVCVSAALIACALVGTGCAPKAETPSPTPAGTAVSTTVPEAAEGLVFVADGRLMVIRDGKAETSEVEGIVQAVGVSADGSGLLVRDKPGESSADVSWYLPESDEFTKLWRSDDAGSLGHVRYLRKADSVWFSVFGDPGTLLKSASPPSSEAMIRALDSSFNGEFDIDSRGEIIAYVLNAQNPSVLMVADAEGESAVPTKLGLIFSPDLAGEGAALCFVGGQTPEDLAVWVFDREQGELRELAGTRKLTPTVPVFSADGSSIAFRSADDGSLWIVDVASGKPQKLPYVADEGPISW